jgi:transcription initiation factor TFIIB
MPTKQSTQAGYGDRSTSSNVAPTAGDCCPECERTDLHTDGREQFCPVCGVVVERDTLERSIPEWIDGDQRHLGPGESSQWLARGTRIGYGGDSEEHQVSRLQRYNSRLRSAEQTLYRGLRELRGICEELGVGEASRERAAHIYRRAVADGLLEGRSLESFAGAAVFVALREHDYPLTLEWLAEAAFATRDELSGAYRVLLTTFDLQVLPPSPADYLPRVASELGVAPRLERTAGRILELAKDAGVSQGKHPAGFAGAALYAAAQVEDRSLKQESVAQAAGVCLVTISRRWQSIDEELDPLEAVDE